MKSAMCILLAALAGTESRTLHMQQQPVAVDLEERPWMDKALPPDQRAAILLAKMNLDEKITMLHGAVGDYIGNVPGNTRLGIPALNLNDGPQGFRADSLPGTSTSFPCGLGVAATWNEDLANKWGNAMGVEFFMKGANVQLGPGMCLARVPVNGRNFEYLSGEDPYLGYRMVQPVIRGIQSNYIIANAKHYVNNNQETWRTTQSADVDERTRFELYYQPFLGAVEAGVGSFMCSYNKINHVWACENPDTLGHLKNELGFEGWVMSDWGATHSTSINAGLDQEMPGGQFMGDALKAAVQRGNVTQQRVDDAVTRILVPMFQVGIFDVNNTNSIYNNVTSTDHRLLAREIAKESIVLLKNNGGVLPLDPKKSSSGLKIAVIGSTAASPIASGGGSGHVGPSFVAPPLTSIRRRMNVPIPDVRCDSSTFQNNTNYVPQGGDNQPATSAEDCCEKCSQRDDCLFWTFNTNTCYFKGSNESETMTGAVSGSCRADANACSADGKSCVYFAPSHKNGGSELAARADVAVVFVYAWSSEGSDRSNLFLAEDGDEMIKEIATSQPNTIVVAVTPGALETQWRDSITGLFVAFMPGEEYGNAITDLLFGDDNPSGKLPLSFPNYENEVNFTTSDYPGDKTQNTTYSEGLLIGYRWYDAHNVSAAYPFGHGLSYTTFSFSPLQIAKQGTNVIVSTTMYNTGSRDAKQVVQLYLKFPSSAQEPPKVLRGFSKVAVGAGESETVTFQLGPESTRIWDEVSHAWAQVSGTFGVMVGLSSTDIRVVGAFPV